MTEDFERDFKLLKFAEEQVKLYIKLAWEDLDNAFYTDKHNFWKAKAEFLSQMLYSHCK